MRSLKVVSSQAIADAFKGTDLTLASAVDEHIGDVLKLVEGNVSAAAKLLGLHRRSLQRKLSKKKSRRARRRRRGRR